MVGSAGSNDAFCYSSNNFCFYFRLTSNSHFLADKTKGFGYWAKPRPEQTRRRAEFLSRVLIIAFGLLLLTVMIPALYDFFQVCRQGDVYLKQIRGKVMSNSSPSGMYFLHQGLAVETKKGEVYENCNAVFLPRHANLGQFYTFLIAPKSGLVLDFESVSSDTNSY